MLARACIWVARGADRASSLKVLTSPSLTLRFQPAGTWSVMRARESWKLRAGGVAGPETGFVCAAAIDGLAGTQANARAASKAAARIGRPWHPGPKGVVSIWVILSSANIPSRLAPI